MHNDRLPPENDLRRTLNVSRVTVRAALKELEEKGLVYQRRGSGTFVGEHSLPQRAELTYVPYVAPSFSKYFRQMEILSGIEDYLKSRGMYVTFHSTGDRESRSEILLRLPHPGGHRRRRRRCAADDRKPRSADHHVRSAVFRQGRRAAQLCCARMADPRKEYEQIYMRTVLLARASTRPRRPAQADGNGE